MVVELISEQLNLLEDSLLFLFQRDLFGAFKYRRAKHLQVSAVQQRHRSWTPIAFWVPRLAGQSEVAGAGKKDQIVQCVLLDTVQVGSDLCSAQAQVSLTLAKEHFEAEQGWAIYLLCTFCLLIYNSFAQFLVKEKGYDKELLSVTPEDWDFCCKGLALDLEDGNFLKLADNGTVLRASHGTKMMAPEVLAEAYGKKEWKHFLSDTGMACRSGKYYFYDNYFDLPGALLCARVVDYLTKQNNGQKTFDFWKDIVAAIQHNYKMSAFKGEYREAGPSNTCLLNYVCLVN
ncbi:PREDICTED: 5'-nucleotidase domain-containing protein 1-like [Mandrillus leucophaeus]|uniref:5'-nucleotidase domain-containing protein 1-like n=1 Tax=Mandrillus leucophaeus TaxID=9568 RepID=UPI0005F36C90|nr:PREDICTED: 5'-nucleotidase domain-containing protein 1-like [Mandrillus leucophaeus]